MISNTPASMQLIAAFTQVCAAGMTTKAELMNLKTLMEMLMGALYQWCVEAIAENPIASLKCDVLGMTKEEIVSGYIAWLDKPCQVRPGTHLEDMLAYAREHGAESMPQYVYSSIRNHIADRYEKEATGTDPLSFLLAGAEDNFVGCLARLARAVGCTYACIANELMAGRQVELVDTVKNKLSKASGEGVTERLSGLMAQAVSYRLPEKYARDRDALLMHVKHQEDRVTGRVRSIR